MVPSEKPKPAKPAHPLVPKASIFELSKNSPSPPPRRQGLGLLANGANCFLAILPSFVRHVYRELVHLPARVSSVLWDKKVQAGTARSGTHNVPQLIAFFDKCLPYCRRPARSASGARKMESGLRIESLTHSATTRHPFRVRELQ